MKKERMNRRKFIGVLGGIAVAGASGALWETLRPKGNGVIPDTEVRPARQVNPNVYTENGKSLVSIVKGTPDTDVEAMVRNAVGAIGGIDKIVSPGMTIVVKPNVVTADPIDCSNPRVVAAVASLAREAGGIVIVAESAGSGTTAYNMEQVGITVAAQAVGAEVRPLLDENRFWVGVPNGVRLRQVETFPTVYDCDVLINVPKLKRMNAANTVTISLKNMMGTISLGSMGIFHSTDLSQCIADLNTVMKPDLTVVDATHVYARTGTERWEDVEMNTILASGDPVALDTIGAEKLLGIEQQNGISTFNPADIRHINAAVALGVGTDDPNQMTLIERNMS
ncbi:MAG: DUF362 domain-containing protein [Candidatus Bathyarchaeota archaeon]|nr:DUF362 domain-containing protein [Candidatus Bathyarchaeota archaeon]